MNYTKKQRELIALAHQIIEGIPGKKIDLEMYRTRTGKSKSCGTICCGAGWLAINPEFNKLGLTTDQDGDPFYQGEFCNTAVNKFFGSGAFYDMFAIRGSGNYDWCIYDVLSTKISDKALLLQRMKIAYHGLDKWRKMQTI